MEKPKLIKNLGLMTTIRGGINCYYYGLYKCFCGNEFIAQHVCIKRGSTKSCGCLRVRRNKINRTLHIKHGMIKTKIYTQWQAMKCRCYCKNLKQYKDWGGRGIIVCDEWKNDFMAFYNWAMANGYSEKLELDRINNNGNYEPSNCRWTTSLVNNQNKRIYKNNTSGYKGVSVGKRGGHIVWRASIIHNKKHYYIGTFESKEEAALGYNNWVIKNKTNHTLNIIY